MMASTDTQNTHETATLNHTGISQMGKETRQSHEESSIFSTQEQSLPLHDDTNKHHEKMIVGNNHIINNKSQEEQVLEVLQKGEEDSTANIKSLSKNALKRLLKKEKWLKEKEIRKEKKKKRKKELIAMKRQENKELVAQGLEKKYVMRRPVPKNKIESNVRIMIDLDFESYMVEKEIASVAYQLKHSYAAVRGLTVNVDLLVTGFNGKLVDIMKERIHGYENWKMQFYTEPLDSNFKIDLNPIQETPSTTTLSPSGSTTDSTTTTSSSSHIIERQPSHKLKSTPNLIYLTADSPNTLTSLTPNTCYIIGGVVDKNRHKFLCYNKAQTLNLNHARLPIQEYIDMKTRHVLTVNQIVEIMVAHLELKDWKQALLKVIPQRKGAFSS